jgi:hypothetical protein
MSCLLQYDTSVLPHVQPPMQWVLGALSPGREVTRREANHPSPCSPRLGVRESIPTLPRPSSWRGTLLSTRTTLPFLPL